MGSLGYPRGVGRCGQAQAAIQARAHRNLPADLDAAAARKVVILNVGGRGVLRRGTQGLGSAPTNGGAARAHATLPGRPGSFAT